MSHRRSQILWMVVRMPSSGLILSWNWRIPVYTSHSLIHSWRLTKTEIHCADDGVARSTIVVSMEPIIQGEYIVVDDVKMLWEMLVSAYESKLKLNIFEIRDDHWSIKVQDCGDVNTNTSQIDWKVKDYSLSAGPSQHRHWCYRYGLCKYNRRDEYGWAQLPFPLRDPKELWVESLPGA